jgi:NHL repeat
MRARSQATLTGLVLLGMLAFGVAPALAGPDYGFTGSFGSATSTTTNPQPLSDPSGVAVNDATKDVYVVDKSNNRVEWFNSAGKFEGEFNGGGLLANEKGKAAPAALSEPEGIAVDNGASSPSKGDVYVVDKNQEAVDKFSATGEYLFQLTGFASAVIGVAVDPSGHVWVAEEGEPGPVSEFDNALHNTLLTSLTPPHGRSPGIAVDSEENLYLIKGTPNVATFNKEGTLIASNVTSCACVTGLAIDPATNSLFVDQGGSSLAEYGPFSIEEGEAPIEEFAGRLSGGGAIAVTPAGTVYAADTTNNDVEIFTPGGGEAPAVRSESASATPVEATLEAVINPDHQETTYSFEYSTSESGGELTGTITTVKGATAIPPNEFGERGVSVPTGAVLEPTKTYFYRVVAKNVANEETPGKVEPVTTQALKPPNVESASVIEATSTSATLLAEQVNPEYQETSAYLQYSTSATVNGSGALTAPTKLTPAPVDLGKGFVPVSIGPEAITGLTAGTTYYYQTVATNITGTTYGPVEKFATVPAPFTDDLGPVTTTTATFNGHFTLNPDFTTQYAFDYNLGSVCTVPKLTFAEFKNGKHQLPQPSTPAEEDPATVTGLEPNAAYTVCFVTSNQFSLFPELIEGNNVIVTVPQLGTPVPFKTEPAPPKFIEHSESAEAISSETAPTEGVGALVNPNNEATSYTFEYSTEGKVEAGKPGALEGTIHEVNSTVPLEGYEAAGKPAIAHIEGLEAGVTYYYRVVANNQQSKEEHNPVYGEVEEFKAAIAPTVTTGAAVDPARTAIVLDGTVNPNGVATTYRFEYIEQAGYEKALAGDAEEKANPYANGASTTPQRACTAAELAANPTTCNDEGTAPVEVEELIKAGLLPKTTYDYALVASTNTGSITGEGKTFTTAQSTPPLVTTGGASEVTLSTATISGSVGTEGLDVKYDFEVSTEPAKLEPGNGAGTQSGGGSIGAGTTEEAVSLALQGLQPGTTYYYKLVATSTDGTVEGTLGSFTTPGFPSQLIQPGTPALIGTPNIAFPKEEANTGNQPSIELVGHKIKGYTAVLKVSVPEAGRLVATGRGISKATAKARRAGTVTVKVRLSKANQRLVRRHHGAGILTTVKLAFASTGGVDLTESVRVEV